MRLRAEYGTGPELKFLAALDRMRLMERSLRRAEIPYALSTGYNPHMKLSMGTVLPVGLWGKKEYLDLDLSQPMEPNDFTVRLNQVLPSGLQVNQTVILSDFQPALMHVINAAAYELVWQSSAISMQQVISKMLSQTRLPIQSRGKKKNVEKDLRRGIYKVEWEAEHMIEYIRIWVGVGEPLNVRYDEIIDLFVSFGVPVDGLLDVYRIGNYVYQNGEYVSPLTLERSFDRA